MPMRFSLLGTLDVLDEHGDAVELGGRQPRTMLAALVVAEGRPVGAERLIDDIWDGTPPASAAGTVQSYVSRLRKRLGATTLVLDDAGYRLDVDPDDLDHLRFERLADEGRALLDAGDPGAAREVLLEAAALWRGPALVEFRDRDFAAGTAVRLEEKRLTALEDRLAADLALGRPGAAVPELTTLVGEHPLRERLQEQLATALYRSGRQAEALRSLAEAGRTLRDDLGIEPSRQLRDLESAILAHDRSLDAPAAPPTAPAPTAPGGPAPATTTAGSPSGTALRPGASVTARVPLVGRDQELGELLAALEESAHDARFVVVEGEPGIGKTRLVDELRIRADEAGALAVWGRSDEGGAAPALWPWLAPLRTVAASCSDVPASVAELLDGEVSMGVGQAQAARYERFEAVADVLQRAADARPLVVLLDDLQWSDATSLELLAFLAGRLERNILVVGTVRQLEVGRQDAVTDALASVARRAGSRRLVVRGLDPEDTARVLGSVVAHRVSRDMAGTIHARAEGNPFYAIELARLLDEEGNDHGEVPGSVGDVIRRRLARLPDRTTELLGVAAVVGREVDLQLLALAARVDMVAALDAVEPAVVHRLLVDVPDQPGQLRFNHALVREVLLEDLSSIRRARLHLQVADAIEARGAGVDDAEILAEHLWRAAPVGVGTRAAEALEQAADVAVRRVAYAAAEDLLRRAVQLRRAAGSAPADQQAELAALLRLLEVARALRYFQGAAAPEVIDRAKELAERTGQHDLLLDLLWFEWSSMATAARIREAAPLAEQYMRLTLADPRPEVQAGGHEVNGVLMWELGRITDSLASLDTSMRLLAEVPPAEPSGFAGEKQMVTRCFWLFSSAASGRADDESTFAAFDDMIEGSPDRFGVASICGFAATTAIAIGDWEHAGRYADLSRSVDPDAQFAFWNGQALMQWGVVRALRGDVDGGIEAFESGRSTYTTIGGRSALPTFQASLAMSLATHADLAGAERFVADARRDLDTIGEMWNAPVVLMAEGVVAGRCGDRERAAAAFAEAAAVAEEQGSHRLAERARRLAAGAGTI